MKKLFVALLVIAVLRGVALATCTKNGDVGATSTQVESQATQRFFIFIQNTGKVNGMHFALGSNNKATIKDTYLGPGAAFTIPNLIPNQFISTLPIGDLAVIQDGGPTTYA